MARITRNSWYGAVGADAMRSTIRSVVSIAGSARAMSREDIVTRGAHPVRHAPARGRPVPPALVDGERLRLRRDAVRHDASRARAHVPHLRRAGTSPRDAWRAGALRAERHRHRRIHPAARRARRRRLAPARPARGAEVPAGYARPALAPARRPPARDARATGHARAGDAPAAAPLPVP